MAAFPAAPVLLFAGFGEEPPSAVRRSQFEDLFSKQLRTASRVLKARPVQYLLRSKADKDAFETFVNDTLSRGADWFDWTDPYDNTVKSARIVNGLVKYTPQRKDLERWIAEFQVETYN